MNSIRPPPRPRPSASPVRTASPRARSALRVLLLLILIELVLRSLGRGIVPLLDDATLAGIGAGMALVMLAFSITEWRRRR